MQHASSIQATIFLHSFYSVLVSVEFYLVDAKSLRTFQSDGHGYTEMSNPTLALTLAHTVVGGYKFCDCVFPFVYLFRFVATVAAVVIAVITQ